MCTQVPAVGLTSLERMRKIATILNSSHASTSTSATAADTLKLLVDIIENKCCTLLRKQDNVPFLCPPTSSCYQCASPLVKNHECSIRYYSTEGLRTGVKVTLRCKKCSITYNYAQDGDKGRSGFKLYPEQRPAVEVSDTLFFDRRIVYYTFKLILYKNCAHNLKKTLLCIDRNPQVRFSLYYCSGSSHYSKRQKTLKQQ